MTTISTLTVTNNVRLGTLNFSSINALPANFSSSSALEVTITGNFANADQYVTKFVAAAVPAAATNPNAAGRLSYTTGLTGTYTAQTATVNRSYGQTGLATLKPLFALYEAKYDATTGAVQPDIDVTLEYQYDSSAAGATISSATVGTIQIDGDSSNTAGSISSTTTGSTTTAIAAAVTSTATAHTAALLDELKKLN
jgi:hypothetical protein